MQQTYVLCTEITESARQTIKAHGGIIRVIHETRPHIELITINNALAAIPCESNVDNLQFESGQGICWLDSEALLRTVYRSQNGVPDDPMLAWETKEEDENVEDA